MVEHLTSFVSSYGYIGIFLILTLNSDFAPLFTEVTLPFAGFLASKGILIGPFIVLASVLGDMIGGTIAYCIGYFLEEKIIVSMINKYGKYILLKEKDYIKTTNIVKKHGSLIVFFAKLTPGIKAWTSLASGICEINFKKYIIASILASIIYNSILVSLGYYLGKNWNIIAHYFNKTQLIPIILIAAGVLWYINHKLKLVKFKSKS